MLRLKWLSMVVVAMVSLASCSLVHTDGEARRAEGATAAPVPTVVVLDASESMLAADAPGPRWDAATQAVESLVGSLPSNTDMGLVVFGSEMAASNTPQEQACRDVKTVLPLAPADAGKVRMALGALTPKGFTPIGSALEAAAELLPDDGEASLVLVSDGEPTCAPDPCEVSSQIRAAHPKATLSTIGFRTDAPSLQCIAEKGGGIFLTADNAAQLTARLAAVQNHDQAKTRLTPTQRGDVKIGQSLRDVVAANPGFPKDGRSEGDRLVIVWQDCTYVFDKERTLVEIAPGDPPGSRGTTIDGVAAGTPGARVVELYGDAVSDDAGSALFVADKKAGTGYRIGYRDGASVGEGTVTTVVLCGCLPAESDKPEPVLGRDRFETYAVGFGTAKPTGISIASTASSSVGNITWESWGGADAIGKGTSQQNGPQNPQSETWVLATDLGWCNGVWAYRGLKRATSRAAIEAKESDVDDICKGDRSEPQAAGAVTLSPSSLLTFGGVGGVFVGDSASKIPDTYVKKEVVDSPGMYDLGTEFYYFRSAAGAGVDYNSEIWVDTDRRIQQISWFATDRGIRIGSTEAEVEAAYGSAAKQTCTLSSGVPTLFYVDAAGRNIVFALMNGAVYRIRAVPEVLADGEHCPFE